MRGARLALLALALPALLGATRPRGLGDVKRIQHWSYAGYTRVKGAAPDAVEGMPNVARWGEAMAARPAIQRALKF